MEDVDVAVIGAGQAGLVGYHLRRRSPRTMPDHIDGRVRCSVPRRRSAALERSAAA